MAMSVEDLREIGLFDFVGWQHAYARPTPAVSSAAAPAVGSQATPSSPTAKSKEKADAKAAAKAKGKATAEPAAAAKSVTIAVPQAPFKELPPEVVAKMSKGERKAYHEQRIAAEKAAKTSAVDGQAPKVLTKAERRAIQEAHRSTKQQAKDSAAAIEETLEELKMAGFAEEQARQMLAEMEKAGGEGALDDDDDDEEEEDLLACVRRYMGDKKDAGDDEEPLHQFQMRVRFQGHSESLPVDHLQCVVRVLACDGCKACDLEAPKLQPNSIAKKVAPMLQKWAGLVDALYTRAGDCLDAVNMLVNSVSDGILDACDKASDRVKDTAFVGIVMVLRDEVESIEDGDLLAGLIRLGDKGPVLQKYIDFLEAELEDDDDDDE